MSFSAFDRQVKGHLKILLAYKNTVFQGLSFDKWQPLKIFLVGATPSYGGPECPTPWIFLGIIWSKGENYVYLNFYQLWGAFKVSVVLEGAQTNPYVHISYKHPIFSETVGLQPSSICCV